MNKGQLLVTIFFLLPVLAACNLGAATPTPTPEELTVAPPATEEPVELTAVVEETQEPTATPTTPAEETHTPTATATTAAVATATLPGQEPEPTDTPAPSPATAPPLPPPTLPGTPDADEARIDYFESNVDVADQGDTITLSWSTSKAVTVTLYKLAATGQLSDFWNVEPAGSFEYQIREYEHNYTRFALFASEADGDYVMDSVEVRIYCQGEWFFDGAPDICPLDEPLESAAAEQHFEGGVMIWVGEEDRIYVLFDDPRPISWNVYTDEWDPGEPDRDPDLLPPSGFFQPVRGFGLVWREQPDVRERLGWAVSEERNYTALVQSTSYAKYNELYIRALDGDIWYLKAERSGWEKISG